MRHPFRLSLPVLAALSGIGLHPAHAELTTTDITIEGTGSQKTIRLDGPTKLQFQKFLLPKGETLNYISNKNGKHPSLNIVRGSIAQIDGTINADGPFYLISPAGIRVGTTGNVQAPSLLLSSLTPREETLGDGIVTTFKSTSNGRVQIDGQLTSTTDDGRIIVMGPVVNTSSTAKITAPRGRVQLIAADTQEVTGTPNNGLTVSTGQLPGTGMVNQNGEINARQIHLVSDGFVTNAGRLLGDTPDSIVTLTAPKITHETRPAELSLIRASRLVIEGKYDQQGRVILPNDGSNPAPLAGLRQTPRLSRPGFITTLSPGQTQLNATNLANTKATVSPIPVPARTPTLVAARRGQEPQAKPKAKTTRGTVRKTSFFGQTTTNTTR